MTDVPCSLEQKTCLQVIMQGSQPPAPISSNKSHFQSYYVPSSAYMMLLAPA